MKQETFPRIELRLIELLDEMYPVLAYDPDISTETFAPEGGTLKYELLLVSDAQNLASVVKLVKPKAVLIVEFLYPPGNALNPFKSFPGVSHKNSLL